MITGESDLTRDASQVIAAGVGRKRGYRSPVAAPVTVKDPQVLTLHGPPRARTRRRRALALSRHLRWAIFSQHLRWDLDAVPQGPTPHETAVNPEENKHMVDFVQTEPCGRNRQGGRRTAPASRRHHPKAFSLPTQAREKGLRCIAGQWNRPKPTTNPRLCRATRSLFGFLG